jgi:hypothetical protein
MSTCQACPENSTAPAGSIGYESCDCIYGAGNWGNEIFDEDRGVYYHELVCPPPVECVAGKYSSAVGAYAASTCVTCAAGTYSETVGASSNSTCIDCAAGTYSSGGDSTCTDCAAGTYSNATGVSACQWCGVGKYNRGSSAMVASPAMFTYKNYEYRTLAGTSPLSTSTQGQDSLIEMPAGVGCWLQIMPQRKK